MSSPATDKIGVGLIGASPDSSWASWSHLPALAVLPEFELRAVSTSRKESAAAAAERYGVPGFDNYKALLAHPGVDLVVVAVAVGHHRELVLAAVEAGKAVYSEWPLGVTLEEAIEMADAARRTQVRTVIGLQARTSPVVNRARDLVAQGYVGRVLSTSVVATSSPFAGPVARGLERRLDKRNGENLLTIPTAHLLDAMAYVVGDFASLEATLATVTPDVPVDGTDETVRATSPDQVALTGNLASGAAASVHIRAGRSRGTNLLWEINGTEGDLLITGPSAHVSNDDGGGPTLHGGRGDDAAVVPLPIPDEYRWVPPGTPLGAPFNVAQQYAQYAADVRNGTSRTPGFDDAVALHRKLAVIQRAADSGTRQTTDAEA